MSTILFDPLYIKTIEKHIGRKLDDFELEAIKFGEPVYFKSISGEWKWFHVPYYKLGDFETSGEFETSLFYYVFDGAPFDSVGNKVGGGSDE